MGLSSGGRRSGDCSSSDMSSAARNSYQAYEGRGNTHPRVRRDSYQNTVRDLVLRFTLVGCHTLLVPRRRPRTAEEFLSLRRILAASPDGRLVDELDERIQCLGGLKWSCRHPDIVPVTSSDG